jgi:hypothetical protein
VKIVALVSAPSGADRVEFRRWYLHDFATRLLHRNSQIGGLAVNVVEGVEAVYPDAKEADTADIYTEFWLPSGSIPPLAKFSSPLGQEELYRVEELVELDRRPRSLGRTPGVKVMSTLYPVENVTARQTRLYWDAHVPLALRVHVGMNGYIREWIEEPLSAVKSPIFGIASMHFANLTDMRERFFDSPDSVPIHAADVARFVSSAAPMITTRYLLK